MLLEWHGRSTGTTHVVSQQQAVEWERHGIARTLREIPDPPPQRQEPTERAVTDTGGTEKAVATDHEARGRGRPRRGK